MLQPDTKVCILPRPSLTDLIFASGLVRRVCERASGVTLYVPRAHAGAMRNLFADVPRLRFQFVDAWPLADALAVDDGTAVVALPSGREACPYALLGLEVDETFVVTRSTQAEEELHERVTRAVGLAYVVIHDDEERRIRRELLPAGFAIVDVRVWRTANPFDWIAVIDRAVEFHGIESCFLAMACRLRLRARKFCHAYASPQDCCVRRHQDCVVIA